MASDNNPDHDDAEEIPVIGTREAQLRQQSGGYDMTGNPAGPAMVDTRSQGTDQQQQPAPQRGGPSGLGAVNASYQQSSPNKSAQSAPPLSPYDVGFKDNLPTPNALREAAKAMGVDADKVPDSYWQQMSQHYADMKNPSTLMAVQTWLKASTAGHYMQGYDDTAGNSDQLYHTPEDYAKAGMLKEAAMMKATQYFNANIQARIIDGGKYYDGNGNYNPPKEYQLGAMVGKAIGGAPPAMGFATGGASMMANAAKAKAGQVLGSIASGTAAFMAAHPAAAKVLNVALHGTILGAAMGIGGKMFGGGTPPIPPP